MNPVILPSKTLHQTQHSSQMVSFYWLTNFIDQSPSWEASNHSVKKFSTFYGIWRFIAVFTRALRNCT